MRAIVVDDEQPARDRLRRMLAEHADVEIVAEASDADGAVEIIDRLAPDVVFLDVQMPGGDGFAVLERVRTVPRVVFTTAFDQYAVRAFEVRSVDYLLKPFARTRLAEALDRVRGAITASKGPPAAADARDEMLRLIEEIRAGLPAAGADTGTARGLAAAPVRIPGRRGAKIVLLDPGDVSWFEADDTLVHARVGESRYLVERPLADLESQLGASFFRTHRAYLVNLSKIAEILPGDAGTWRIVIKDEARSQVPLSRRQAQKLREIIPW